MQRVTPTADHTSGAVQATTSYPPGNAALAGDVTQLRNIAIGTPAP